jgi:Protein of unknown function (DUF2865)
MFRLQFQAKADFRGQAAGRRNSFALSALSDQRAPMKAARAMEVCLTVRPHRAFGTHAFRLLIAAVAAAIIVPPAPASAQGLFDFLFGSHRRSGPPPSASSYADPNSGFDGERRAAPSGPSVVFCVRVCDGRYFPIQRSSGANAAQLCSSFCPASQTKVFSGGGIDHAVASDGSRYASLRNAFAYRERIVENCSCNGHDPYGLVTQNTTDDPTLRTGDIVATNDGFVAYNGSGRRNAEFTPIQSYPGLSAEWRQRLAHTRIVPSNATPVSPEAVRQGAVQDNRGRRVQVDR